MNLRIVCFEDNPGDLRRLERLFRQTRLGGAKYVVDFLFYRDPDSDWDITARRAAEIRAFGPDFAIVDLISERHDAPDGMRVIRQLKESEETGKIPIVVWSVALKNDSTGQDYARRIREMGAVPILKNRKNLPPPERFIRASGRKSLLINAMVSDGKQIQGRRSGA